jgi:hypothetical protein
MHSLAFIAFAVQNWDLACDNPMKEWMVVILVCFIANIAFTVYMWKKLGYLVNGEVPLDEVCVCMYVCVCVCMYVCVCVS